MLEKPKSPTWKGQALIDSVNLNANKYTATFYGKVRYSEFVRILKVELNFGDESYIMNIANFTGETGLYSLFITASVPINVVMEDNDTPLSITVQYEYSGVNGFKTSNLTYFNFMDTFDGNNPIKMKFYVVGEKSRRP